jgi:curved DNA-binding protein CbpA
MMDARLRTRFEVEAISELLGELSHYQLLGLKSECAQDEIDVGFRNESRRLHPDRVAAGATPELKGKANDVFKSINEAYRVLRDPDLRRLYDQTRAAERGGEEDESRRSAESVRDPSKAARTPKGEKYWKMALQCWEAKDYTGCKMQIQFALTCEPNNETFKEWQVKAQAGLDAKKKDTGGAGNSYRIRLG